MADSCCDSFCLLLALLALFLLYKLLDRIIRIPQIGRYSERYILITGCDTGFGRQLAQRLDSMGCQVFAGCLTEKGETELTKTCSSRLKTIPLDVTKPESVRKAFGVVNEALADRPLWAIVNNAGISISRGPPEWITLAHYKETMDVNLFGLIDVTMTFLPLIKKSRGRVVNMSSGAGRGSVPGLIAYSVSKYGVEAFTDGLRRSLRPYKCKAHLLEPGFYNTFISSRDHGKQMAVNAWNTTSAEIKEEFGTEYFRYLSDIAPEKFGEFASEKTSEVVDCYVHAILGRYPRARYVVGPMSKLWLAIGQMPEWLGDWMCEQLLLRGWPLPAVLNKASGEAENMDATEYSEKTSTKETVETSHLTTGELEERQTFVITGVTDPRSGKEISYDEATTQGIINQREGRYINPATGESQPMQTAMNDGKIKVEWITVKKSRETRKEIGFLTIKTYKESRPYTIKGAVDAVSERSLSVDEAVKAGILDRKREVYINKETNEELSFSDALDSGLLLVEFTETEMENGKENGKSEETAETKKYAVHTVLDIAKNKRIGLKQAIDEGIIDQDKGSFINASTRERINMSDAIKKGFIRASVVRDVQHFDT